MACQVFCDNRIAVKAAQTIGQDGEFAFDWFVRIRNAAGVGAPHTPFNQCRDLDSFLLVDLEIADNVDGCPGGI